MRDCQGGQVRYWRGEQVRDCQGGQVRDWSLLMKWEGREADLPAVVMISHLDVVPATSPEAWAHPPFSGTVADG